MKKITTLAFCLLLNYFAFSQGIDKPQYQIITNRAGNYLGTFNVELFPLIAPMHVANFDSLVSEQFYDSTAFHRVVPGFVIQGGDPNSVNGPINTWGLGQPWQVSVPAEFSAVRHLRGILGAARDTDPNSANSQFYICVANATSLDGNYTVYGKVISGINIVDTIVNSPRDANDVPLQKIEMFITYIGVNDSIPAAPILNSPSDGSTAILNTQTFSWSIVNEAVLYTIELSTDVNFSTIDITKTVGSNSTMITSLGGSTQYYWRVKSNNGGHESGYSNSYSFTSATAAPALIYPADTAINIPINAVFSWSNVTNATDYTLQVSTSSTFTTQSMIYNVAGLADTFQLVSAMNPNSLYYWRVRSAKSTVQGFYSPKFSFTTGTSTGINTLVNKNKSFEIENVYPNPARDFLTVKGYMQNPGNVIFKLTDQAGRVVFRKIFPAKGNEMLMMIPLTGISPATYILSVRLRDEELFRTIEIR